MSAGKELRMTDPLASEGSQKQNELVNLCRRAQAGSAEAAQILFDRCRQPLLTVIRRTLLHPLRRLYDSDDFLADTFVVIFTRHFSDDVLDSPETLWPYLKKIAENKVRDAQRKWVSGKRRDLTREVPLAETPFEEESWSKDFRPEEALLLKELVQDRVEHLLTKVPAALGAILELLLQGYNGVEIAHRLGMESKRVYRSMDWLRSKVMEE